MNILNNIKLADYSSYKIGGEAKYFITVTTIEEIKEAIAFAHDNNLKFFILGGGTNLLFSDEGYDGLIIKNEIRGSEITGEKLIVKSGENLTLTAKKTLENGLSGMEWAYGIPGSVGGAIRGNAGAYGGEMKDNILTVTSINLLTGELVKRENKDCNFGYRNSIYKQTGTEMILEAEIGLKKDGNGEAMAIAERHMQQRKDRHPLDKPCAGSTFKNVDARGLSDEEKKNFIIKEDPFLIIPIGSLIEGAGMKGFCVRGACISTKHANFLVNENNATATDVIELIDLVKEKIKEKYGFVIEPEIQIVEK